MSEDASAQSPFTAELNQRKAHLEGLPGHQLNEDLEALRRCRYVFNTNATELAAHVGEFLHSSQFSRDVSEDYVNDLVRLYTQLFDVGYITRGFPTRSDASPMADHAGLRRKLSCL